MKFNINDTVRVRLTDHGRKVLRANHIQLYRGVVPYQPVEEDADGWSEWQLWQLMQDLGASCGLGCEPPFETEIELTGSGEGA